MPRLRAALPALIGLALFLLALEVLRTELRAVTWQGLVADLAHIDRGQLALAAALTVINYVVLTGYDFLAFASLGKTLPWRRIAAASFLAYAISNNVGFAMLSGASVRYRFYTRWGVTAEELSRLVFSYVTTFWVGLLFVGGWSLAVSPVARAAGIVSPVLIAPAGGLLIAVSLAYLAASTLRVRHLRILGVDLPFPPPLIAWAQLGISVVDWVIAATIFYTLLPRGTVPFSALLAAFLASQLLGLASHVPGGVGVFEGLMVILLKPFVSSAVLAAPLVAYRVVYYLMPLSGALIGLLADEFRQRRAQAARVGAAVDWLTQWLTPRVLALFTFLGGWVLLASGATPAAAGRLHLLNRVLPLGLIETSHFAGSVVGAALLLLSQGLSRRLNTAWGLTVMAASLGAALSLLKGGDYEEASILAVLLVVLWRARPAFDRRGALLDTRFSPAWIAAVIAAVGSSIWLGLFAFKHVEYSHQLWWQFELHGEASRMLRASVGASVTVLLFAISRLLGFAPHEAPMPTDAELRDASVIIARQIRTSPNLVFLRDKAILFDQEKTGFVMYGVQGRTWVALGDPVGPADRAAALIRLFLERCDDFAGTPVFYEVSNEHLDRFIDCGLTFVKLGEEARVNLQQFSTADGHGKKFRQAIHRLEREHATFRVVPVEQVEAILSQLRRVSDEWLSHRAAAEKGFSLGFFDEAYVARFPIAVIERGNQVLAFANIWPGAQQNEVSIDLMRYGSDAPKDVMDGLFVHLMLWARAQGYRWFSLGMAPLSGFERSPVAPLWNRLASFVYVHGGAVYNFQGLRSFKNKFDPVWESRYLAYPGGLHLPRVMADISALVAGGYRRIFLR